MSRKSEPETDRLDDAARAGWLYYIAGNTQDEIARKLGVSRQTAQRLVSLSITERLIKVRLDHAMGNCLELASRLRDKYELLHVEVVPADPESTSDTLGIAEAAAAELERALDSSHPVIVGVGTGRTLRAMAELLRPMDCPQHKIVSLVGNIGRDGSASFFDVASRVGDRARAPYYPMPTPVMASTVSERNLLLGQKPLQNIMDLALQADVSFVAVGTIDPEAPLLRDGFVKREELNALIKAGAVGEITGRSFDDEGNLIDGLANDLVLSVPMQQPVKRKLISVTQSLKRLRALRGALKGKLVSGLITNEIMASSLLQK